MNWLEAARIEDAARTLLSGASILRDRGALESACSRAKNAYHYMGVSLFEAAAYYSVGLAKSHPFVDGNKRIAWMAATLFLLENGFAVAIEDANVSSAMMVGAADGTVSIDRMAGFLEGAARKINR